MREYIDRDALKEKFWDACKNCLSEDDVADLIDDIPAADVIPVIHAHWIVKGDNPSQGTCSHCGGKGNWRNPYCPNCGAKCDLEG